MIQQRLSDNKKRRIKSLVKIEVESVDQESKGTFARSDSRNLVCKYSIFTLQVQHLEYEVRLEIHNWSTKYRGCRETQYWRGSFCMHTVHGIVIQYIERKWFGRAPLTKLRVGIHYLRVCARSDLQWLDMDGWPFVTVRRGENTIVRTSNHPTVLIIISVYHTTSHNAPGLFYRLIGPPTGLISAMVVCGCGIEFWQTLLSFPVNVEHSVKYKLF